MQLEITHRGAAALDTIDFTASGRYENGAQYEVRYGGVGSAADRTSPGVLVGYVARLDSAVEDWLATADQTEPTRVRWYSGFRTRKQAGVFLVGMRFEQDMPSLLHTRGHHRLLRDHPAAGIDESLPYTRRDEVAFRRAVPAHVGGLEVLAVHRWRPGDVGAYASATVVFRHDSHFCVHKLYWVDDNPHAPWQIEEGHYGIPTIERAHQRAAVIAATT